jgi:chorismate lyase/3-hydroxybenzoate synthase
MLVVEATSPVDAAPNALAIMLAASTAGGRHDIVTASGATSLPFRWLGGTSRAETWRMGVPPARRAGRPGGAGVTEGGDFQFGHLVLPMPATAIEDVTEAAYREVLAASNHSGYPHLLRVWNYFGGINEGDGDREHYRRFCVGRARAIPTEPVTGYAAATAIGIPGPSTELQISWLASRHPGVPIENPRQVSAWEYPREYGPVAPGFSRAMLVERPVQPLLLVSGTASVVGHESRHDEALAQLDEALVNLEQVIGRAAARIGLDADIGPRSVLRVYLRDAGDAPAIGVRLVERFGGAVPFMLLEGDICRRELLVELEAVHAF